MHKLKHVHDTFKVLQFFFTLIIAFIAVFDYDLNIRNFTKIYIYTNHNAPVKQCTDSQPQHLHS